MRMKTFVLASSAAAALALSAGAASAEPNGWYGASRQGQGGRCAGSQHESLHTHKGVSLRLCL